MKIAIFLVLSFVAFACSNQTPTSSEASTSLSFASPESIVEFGNFLYVSNVGKELKPMDKNEDGFILKCDLKGNPVAKFAANTIMHAPKGLEVINHILYVTDIDRVLGFDIKTEKKVFESDLSKTGGKFFNDVEAYYDELLVSATDLGKIYIINLSTGNYRVLQAESELRGPNGLCYDQTSQALYVAEWGTGTPNGRLVKIDVQQSNENETYPVQVLTNHEGNLDGICKMDSTFLFSDWATGAVYQFSPNTNQTNKYTKDSLAGPADFTLGSKGKLWIPEMMASLVTIE